MKIIITESQLNILLAEASKVEVLIDKLGFEPDAAKYLEVLCGGLSVWVGKKLAKYLGDPSKLDYNSIKDNEDKINSIMKWIKIGLNGNFKQHQDSSFMDLLEMATEWIDSKHIKIDKENVIIDFRDSNGLGYYWANLGKSECREEGKRMKHCGSAKEGTLYSLRRNFPTKDAYKSNESVVTAEITPNGELVQLRGVANSKPQEKYYPYIIGLLTHKIDNDRYLVTSISSYDGELRAVLANSEKLLKSRPDLFDAEYKSFFPFL